MTAADQRSSSCMKKSTTVVKISSVGQIEKAIKRNRERRKDNESADCRSPAVKRWMFPLRLNRLPQQQSDDQMQAMSLEHCQTALAHTPLIRGTTHGGDFNLPDMFIPLNFHSATQKHKIIFIYASYMAWDCEWRCMKYSTNQYEGS